MTAVISAIEERLSAPTSRGLASAVSATIHAGILQDNDRLPPIRTVATQLNLSPTTVSAAWAILRRSGTIATDGRRGSRITRRQLGPQRYRAAFAGSARSSDTNAAGTRVMLDLSTGTPDPALLPNLGRVLADITVPAVPASYLDDPVVPELAATLRRSWPYPPERFTITDGALDALQLLVTTHLQWGEPVAVEQPCFPPLLDLLEAHGLRTIPVDLDDNGPLPLSVAAAQAAGAKALFFQPRGHNPTGARLTADRRNELARLLTDTTVLVVEDDSVGDISGAPAISLGEKIPQHTISIRSFSKSHGPDLRLAAVAGSHTLLGAMIERRFLGQGWSSRLLQHVLLAMLTDTATMNQIATARDTYAQRRATVVRHLARRGITVGGEDGLNIWLPVVDETAALVLLASHGIAALPGGAFMISPGDQAHIRVTTGRIPSEVLTIADLLADAATVGPRAAVR